MLGRIKKLYRNTTNKNHFIQTVSEKTGWSHSEAKKAMEDANRRLGLSFDDYCKYEFFAVPVEEQEDKYKRIKRYRKAVASVAKAAGIKKSEARELIDEAKSQGISNANYSKRNYYRAFQAGIPYSEYERFQAWNLTDEELEELAKYIDLAHKKNEFMKEWFVDVAVEKSGMDRDLARRKLMIVLEKGYSGHSFIRKCLYKKPIKKLKTLDIRGEEKDDISVASMEAYEEKAVAAKGWNHSQYLLDLFKARVLCGCNSWEYMLSRIYNYSDEDKGHFLTTFMKEMMVTRYIDWENKGYLNFKDKTTFNTLFKDFTHRDWFILDDLNEEEFLERISTWGPYLVYKPENAMKGRGIQKFAINESLEQNREVYKTLHEMGEAIIEKCIVQHDVMASFYPGAIDSIRIVTMRTDDHVDFLVGMFRTGRDGVVDNWSAGGVCAGIDLETGLIRTEGLLHSGDLVECHPVTGTKFRGTYLPYWDRVREECTKAAKVVENSRMVGWDITITPDGEVVFIEGNHSPGVIGIQAAHSASEGILLEEKYRPFLYFEKNLLDFLNDR